MDVPYYLGGIQNKMKESMNFDFQLELEILNFSVFDRAFWLIMLDHLEPHYFDNKITKAIFLIFKFYFEKYNELPSKKVTLDRIKRTDVDQQSAEKAVDFVFSENSNKDKNFLLEEVKSFAKKARMKDALVKSVEFLEKNKYEQIYHTIKEALIFSIDIDLGISIWDIDERYDKINKIQETKIPTGWPSLDSKLDGGWEKKTLNCFGAPPGIGKSIFLVNSAVNAFIRNYNVVLYTLEISQERMAMRADSVLSGIPSINLRHKVEDLKTKLLEVRKRTKGKLIIKEFPTKKASVNAIMAHLEDLKIHQEIIPDLIIIDYADIMAPVYRYSSKYEELGSIYEDLRGLAVEMNVPIVTASQTNRESMAKGEGGTKEIITAAFIADSIIKLQILDFFATISQSAEQRTKNEISLFIAKNRNGRAFEKIIYNIDYNTFKLKDIGSE